MKLTQLKDTLREVVREVIQDELKDILLEAVKSNRQTIQESRQPIQAQAPLTNNQSAPSNAGAIRESYMNVLGDMKSQFTSGHVPQTQGLKVSGNMDTTSPNSSLPEGEVSLDQVMGLMKRD